MDSLIRNPSFHHLELPCEDLDLAEKFYSRLFGAVVYMRRDADRRPSTPVNGSILEAEEKGFKIDGTYLKIGSQLRIGFLKRQAEQNQREIDHLAFAVDEEIDSLDQRLKASGVEIVDQKPNHILIRDPFGMLLELWPRSVLEEMGVL